jgi:hypothetical protein
LIIFLSQKKLLYLQVGVFFCTFAEQKATNMKRHLLSFLLLLLTITIKAQYGGYESAGHLGINMCYIEPGNDFEQQAFYKPNSGYALTGYGLSVTYSKKMMHSRFGISGLANFSMGQTDVNGFRNSLPHSLNVSQVNSSALWLNANIIAGPMIHVNLFRRLSVNFQLMGGLNYISLPEYTSHDANNSMPILKEDIHSFGYSYDFGIGVRYSLTPSTFLLFNADFMSSHNTKEALNTIDPSGKPTTVDYSASIGINMLSLGYAIALD